jgi:hypothetical protein
MKKQKRLTYTWRLVLRRLLVLCSFGFLATGACDEAGDMYGMPPVPQGRVKAADTRRPIPGIQVSVAGTQQKTITGTDGYFILGHESQSGALLLEDIDGARNGEFYDKTVTWNGYNSYFGDIYMERKE